jgi:trans-aconitate methyltransferase
MKLYGDLVPFYHLVDPVVDHEEEVASYDAALASAIVGPYETLLELGAGAGNNGFFFKRRRRCTLTDVSRAMLDLSRAQNPECEHVAGDMRTLRLGRQFDAVMVHDAIVYMCSEQAIRDAAETAFLHTRPGGAAVFAPDCVAETFKEFVEDAARSDGTKSAQYTALCWRPDEDATTYRVDYAFLVRDSAGLRAVHDTHHEGLFSRSTWTHVLEQAGFVVDVVPRDLGEEETTTGYTDEFFLCRRV